MSQGAIEYRRLRAPRGQGEVLIQPSLAEAGELADANRRSQTSVYLDLGGVDFQQLRTAARRQLLTDARSYTAHYRELPPAETDAEQPLVLAGHQPELFHAGVWFKNFVLSRLAARLRGPAVNLIIDNDTLAAPSIRVPGGTPAEPRVESVAFDRPAEPLPYEQRAILDRNLFDSFAERVEAAGDRLLPPGAILQQMWPEAVKAADEHGNAGRAIARARHKLEGAWGLETLELPLSTVCRGEAFRRFLLHLVGNLEEFAAVYNGALAEYRRVHRLRGRSHPAPDLQGQAGLLEAPFWIWSNEHPRRQRLFVRASADGWELTDQATRRFSLRLPRGGSPARQAAVGLEVLAEAEQSRGLKIRPRALITTLFARLFLGDLFLHGIGGAKYDQLTDAIIARFFGIEPPRYLTVSATVYPPVPMPPVEPADLSGIASQLRELTWHPEKHVDLTRQPAAAPLVAAKREAVAADGAARSRRARHEAIAAANASLQSFVAGRRTELERQFAACQAELRRKSKLHVREYAFCLFSENFLRHLLLDQTLEAA